MRSKENDFLKEQETGEELKVCDKKRSEEPAFQEPEISEANNKRRCGRIGREPVRLFRGRRKRLSGTFFHGRVGDGKSRRQHGRWGF